MKNFLKWIKINIGLIIKIAIAVIIIGLIITLFVLYAKNENFRELLDKYIFRKETYEDELPYIEIDSSKILNTYAYDRYIAIMQGNKLEFYNKFRKI